MDSNDGLVATRQRRANAGSRLKQLIELEEASSGVQQTFLTEEDEDVHLLFQEDENDAEFEEEEEEEEEEEGEDEGEEGEEGKENDDAATDDPRKEAAMLLDNEQSDAEANPDEMLSDSDLSVSEDDDSEGERELQREERAKKRKKKQTIIPAIKKRTTTTTPQPKQPSKPLSSMLQYGERRSSSRKSAVKNKEDLLQKLKADETRRAGLTPIKRVKEREPTQEERLAQAQETEKENTLSLNAFLEQEVKKKERQKLMFQQKRPKLRNVIRLVSKATFVTPLEEIEDARHVQDMFEKKRRGRRRKNVQEEPDVKRPGDVDTELPYYKQEMAEKERLEAIRLEEKRKLEEARAERRRRLEHEREERKRKLEEEREARRILKEKRLKEFENIDATDPNFSAESLRLKGEISSLEEQDREAEEMHRAEYGDAEHDNDHNIEDDNGIKKDSTADTSLKPHGMVNSIDEVRISRTQDNTKRVDESKEEVDEKGMSAEQSSDKQDDSMDVDESLGELNSAKESAEIISDDKATEASSENPDDIQMKLDKDADEKTKGQGKETSPNSAIERDEAKDDDGKDEVKDSSQDIEVGEKIKIEKKVTFSEDVGEKDSNVPEQSVKEEPSTGVRSPTEEKPLPETNPPTEILHKPRSDGEVFEGPVQYVSRNYIILLDFDDEDRYWKLPETKMKIALFGEESLLSASRRFRDVKTILRSTTRNENPYATTKDEKEDELFKPVSEITEESPMFDDLKRLRRLGVRVGDEEEEEEETKEEENVVHINTEAPTGLYLPNGNKKICLISGKEVRYFDPGTGVPYDSVDDYKVIKSIEAGNIPWYSIPRDQNTYGAVEIYLNNREGTRHAKGVPEGFDGC